MTDKDKKQIRLFVVMAAAVMLLFLLVVLIGLGAGDSHKPLLPGEEAFRLEEGWLDSQGQPVTVPLRPAWEEGRWHSYTIVLPEREENQFRPALLLTTRYLNAWLYLDGEPLGQCLAKPVEAANSLGTVYSMFLLPEDCVGQTLRLEVALQLGSGVSYEIQAPIVGSRQSITARLLKEETLTCALNLALLCFGGILVMFGLLRGASRTETAFLYTGLFAVAFAVYSLCAGDALHLYSSRSYLIYMLEFLLLAFLPLPVVAGVRQRCSPFWRRLLTIDLILVSVNLFVQAGLHFFTPLELRQTVWLTHLLMAVTVLILVPVLVGNFKAGEKNMLIIFAPIILGASADIALFYFSSAYRSAVGVTLGVLAFVILETADLIRTYLRYYENDLQGKIYERMAYTDGLTGLGNRTAFEHKQAALAGELPVISSLWCVCADINNLKQVNDTLGHDAGDKIIRQTAESLQTVMGPHGSLYRVGGDEFVMFLQDQPEQAVTEGLQRFHELLAAYNQEGNPPLSVAVGYDRFHFDGRDSLAELLRRADKNMYGNKQELKERWEWPPMEQADSAWI